jgi:hypothetical protein
LKALFPVLILLVAGAAQAADPVILPGRLDLPVTFGNKAPEGCAVFTQIGLPAPPASDLTDCVTTTGAKAQDAINAYTKALKTAGWTFVGGAAIQYWFERPKADGRCEGVNLTGLVDFKAPKAQMMKGPAVIAFEFKPDAACRAQKS